ncbi:MAG: hypothetical protein ABMA64_31865 [Myxococcota bacterium]
MTGLLRQARPEVRSAAEQLLGELAHEGVALARADPRLPLRPRDSRSIDVHVERPALLRFRVRALVGLGGRVDVLMGLVAAPSSWVSAGDLDDAGIAKRNVAVILAELAEAGIAHTRRRGNVREFRLANAGALAQVVAVPAAAAFPDWRAIFEWMHLVDELEHIPADRPATLRVEVARRRAPMASLAATLGLPNPTPPEESAEGTKALLAWGREIAEDLSNGVGPAWKVHSNAGG